jgi:heme/copper-type cytochrome/quinol oxidase subunit 2
VFFFVTAAVLLIALIGTVSRTPYGAAGARPDRIVYVAAQQFGFSFSLEPIVSTQDLARVPIIQQLELPAGALLEFRVTSLDVNHNFALYGPQRRVLAQTQAMPGYVNRLLVRLDTPGRYHVLCLEYCGAGHHLMQTELTVK